MAEVLSLLLGIKYTTKPWLRPELATARDQSTPELAKEREVALLDELGDVLR